MSTMPIAIENRRVESTTNRLHIAHYLFLLYWMMKPFYFGPSGNMQLADFIFVLAFVMWIFVHKGNVLVDRREFPLAMFLLLILVINGIYFFITFDNSFLLTSAYYTYCFMIVLVVRDFMQNKRFLRGLMWTSAFNLIIQMVVLLLGLGRFMWRGLRFMGTFNDPNQFAFSMFSSFLLVFILSSYMKEEEKSRKKLLVLSAFLFAAYFIVQGGSTGMLLGVGAFALVFMLTIIYSERTPAFQFLKILAIITIVAIVALIAVQGINVAQVDGSASSSSFLIFRLLQKINLVESGGVNSLFEDRAITRIFNFPIYLIFGSGEGAHTRFPDRGFEVHSTFPGIFFYYGIIPFLILCFWIYGNLKNASRILVPVYLALLVESLTLAHQRQPTFWMIILLGSLPYANPKKLRRYRMVVSP